MNLVVDSRLGNSPRPAAPSSSVHRLASHGRRLQHPVTPEHQPVLVLGGAPDLPHFEWHDDPAIPCSAVLLAGKVSADDLAAALEQMPEPAVPIADFAGNRGLRSDFFADVLDDATFNAAKAQFEPIVRRLADIPFRAPREDRGDMQILRMAYSRDCAITARFAPGMTNAIDYPLLDRSPSKRLALEGLALRDLLSRRHFMRTHSCDHCNSSRLLAFEACSSCGGSDLVDESLVHHYRCGWHEPETNFVQGHSLVCPKCRRTLRHFGIDYGKPGSIVHCRTCGASAAEPDPRFACLDCAATINGQAARATDWFHYELTEAGVAAVHSGRLPGKPDTVRFEGPQGACSLREFLLLANAALRNARRFQRPFTVAECAPANLAAIQAQFGGDRVEELIEQAAAAIARSLSDSEFVAAAGDHVLVGFPERTPAELGALRDVVKSAPASLDAQVEFQVELSSGDQVAEILGRYG